MGNAPSQLQPSTREESSDRLARLRPLANARLTARLLGLAGRERRATALLVACLAEFARRELHLAAGFSSLFAYCRDVLRLSEHEAYNRIEGARTVRRLPGVVERLAAGTVNLTTLRLLSPHLNPENQAAVLESASGRRKAEVEEIVARLAPFPEAPTFLRRLPTPKPASGVDAPSATSPASLPSLPASPASLPAASPTGPPEARAGATAPPSWRTATGQLTPLAPERYRLQVTIPGPTVEKLRLAKDMLRHAIPSGDEAAILDRALTVLLADLARAKFAATDRPRVGREAAPGSRHIPAEVRRAVWLRDCGRCAFTSPDGRRCDERAFVEFHHVRPWASEGESTVENVQLRCRRHNDYEARRFFVHRQA